MASNCGLLVKEAIMLLDKFNSGYQCLVDFFKEASKDLQNMKHLDKKFIFEVVSGCVEHKKLLDAVINIFYDKNQSCLLRRDRSLFVVICYLTTFSLDDLGLKGFRDIVKRQDIKKTQMFVTFFFTNLTTSIKAKWNTIYDAAFVEEHWIGSLLRWRPEIDILMKQVSVESCQGEIFKKAPIKTTKPKEFSLNKPKPRPLPTPEIISQQKKVKPTNSAPIEANGAVILRQEAAQNYQEEKEMQRVEDLAAGTGEPSAFHQWQKDICAKDLQVEMDKIDLRFAQRCTNNAKGAMARKHLTELNQRAAQMKKEETAELMRTCAEERLKDKKEIKALMQQVAGGHMNAKTAKEKLQRLNQMIVREVSMQNRELLRKALQEEEAELIKKFETIQEIHAIESVPRIRFRKFDDTETAGDGLLGEMSLFELKERLFHMKEQQQREQQEKRERILAKKKKMEKQQMDLMMEDVKKCKNKWRAEEKAAAIRKQEERNGRLRKQQEKRQSDARLALQMEPEKIKQEYQRMRDEERQRRANLLGKKTKTSQQANVQTFRNPEKSEANGESYAKLAQKEYDISSNEMFWDFPSMVGLSFFPRLCKLTIANQDIEHIEGLEGCPLLRELRVFQCHLKGISGLQNCLQLQKLYLHDNQISEITNLELQVKLEVLWLNNNRISQIQGLNTLQNLKELNLADNNIEKIGHSLDLNASLQNLNLSGDKISSFKELTMLAHLPHLTDLALKDPMSTPMPVCQLSDYVTFVLYHLPGLQQLDVYDVSSNQVKEAAESTMKKKMMHYNMCERTARRSLASTRLKLMERKKTISQLPEECFRRVSHALKNLECELSKVPGVCKKSASKSDVGSLHLVDSHDPAMEPKIRRKMEALRERLHFWTRRLNEIEVWHERDSAQARKLMESTVQFLQMELESVGNICLEEGSSTDSWFISCCNLLQYRFSNSDLKAHGITGIKINRVIRIHNNALRLRFEDKLLSLQASEEDARYPWKVNLDGWQKLWEQQLECLFYDPEPGKNDEKDEILCILEEGFKTATQYKTLDRVGAIPLSNSWSVIEQPRMEHALGQASEDDSKHSADMIPFRHGQIILSKAYVGHSVPFRGRKPFDRSSYPGAHSVYHYLDTKHRTALSRETSHSSGTHTGPEPNPRQRQWFVFDRELVLPEYLIDFEYIAENQEQSVLLDNGVNRDGENLDMEVLNMEPALKPQPNLSSLDDNILLNVTGASDLSQIIVLNLRGNSLSKMDGISSLPALQHLTISFNQFTRLDDISHMPNLEFLDASHNQLVTLDGLPALGQLKQLDVCWNKLTKAEEDSVVLRKCTPALLKLDTRYNPWNRPESVRGTILGHLTTLTHLNDKMVTEEDASDAVQMIARSKMNQASCLAHSRTNNDRPRTLSLLSTAQLLCLLNPSPFGLNQELDLDWTTKITVLNLDNQGISKLSHLTKLVNLRWASFNDNDISKVEGLEYCSKLEELSLNNNSISTLDGLSKLRSLTKLSVDGNQLSSLDASVLDQLPNLSSLSVENNCISSLHGIESVFSLLELHVGNNQISTSGDIYYLKGLTNLVLLDLYGNPLLEEMANYWMYVVFQLPFLQALDGITVEVTESERAKHMFKDTLIPDMVTEKLGHSNYADITCLTLPSCSIRAVDLYPPDLFCSLHSVNLDHNNLTSFSGLINLPNIKALSLNYNCIESILPRERTHQTNRQMMYNHIRSSGYGKQSGGKWETRPILEPLMGSLEVLHLSHNGISNMANLELSRLTNLKVLFLQGNGISQVEGLNGLHQLRELVLDKNRIRALDVNSFMSQSVLLELHVAENRIRAISRLSPLIELRKLFLGMNKLQDIAELEKLDALPSLTVLSVAGNPLARKAQHRMEVVLYFPRLHVLDGERITSEERTTAELLAADSSAPLQEDRMLEGYTFHSLGRMDQANSDIIIFTNPNQEHYSRFPNGANRQIAELH